MFDIKLTRRSVIIILFYLCSNHWIWWTYWCSTTRN